eukprot:CAMPEP_0201686570 /NCGR_PEP_ID=MMETSP0578-20130828/967_1 /ASSEMBLY_ACC=CAM_ASM_000663 /TAXON_ID=267565 /ORGANISM="Skeletonema grethea, Strain CCMP 1804" /LENGTH=472 /DNA_ID=CAMNT_0048170639 /DNA_START=124 /DNA_END=1542 /DNA_ORIENTATION=-
MSSTLLSQPATNVESSATEATPTNSSPKNKQSSCSRYIVSRNGIVLPWQQIHQQYRVVDGSGTCDNSSNQLVDKSEYKDDDNTPLLDSNTLLQLLPRGAYTTCRTVKGGTHIYQFDYHVTRLANSAKSIILMEERQLDSFEVNQLDITNVAWEHDMALKCIRTTLKEFCTSYGIRMHDGLRIDNCSGKEGDDVDEKAEFKITLLATWEKKKKQHDPSNNINSQSATYESVLYCHVGLLQPTKNVSAAPTSTVSSTSKPLLTRVLIHGHGRENALAKDSKWVLDREKLTKPSILDVDNREEENNKGDNNEEDWHQPFEEIILINDNGELLEGTQTNFYVVTGSHHPQPHSIITANEGILYGSVRDSVLSACRHHEIPVQLRPPTLKDLKSASGVFISSTSRWVMPVDEVCLGDLLSFENDDNDSAEEEEGGGIESVDEKKRNGKSCFYGACKTTEDIRRWVLEDVQSRSTPLH